MSAGLHVTEPECAAFGSPLHVVSQQKWKICKEAQPVLKTVSLYVNTGEGQADGNVNHFSCHFDDTKHKGIKKITGSSVTQMPGVL